MLKTNEDFEIIDSFDELIKSINFLKFNMKTPILRSKYKTALIMSSIDDILESDYHCFTIDDSSDKEVWRIKLIQIFILKIVIFTVEFLFIYSLHLTNVISLNFTVSSSINFLFSFRFNLNVLNKFTQKKL